MAISENLLKDPRYISVHYGIKWITWNDRLADRLMVRVYKNRSKSRNSKDRFASVDYSIAEAMRSNIPSVTGEILAGKAKETRIVHGKTLLLATPPRLYTEWGREFLKSDICVMGPGSREDEILREFRLEKAESIREKRRAPEYVKRAVPLLDRLLDGGLIVGVLGRGSYFGKNGFPRPCDDIDFILFAKDGSSRTEKKIIDALKGIPLFAVLFVIKKDKLVKKGRPPAFSFVIVHEGMRRRVTRYESYVLRDSIGIGLKHLKKEESEALARRLARSLPEPSK